MVLLEVKFIWTEEGICGTSCLTMCQNLVVTILLLFFIFGLPTDTGSISGFGRAGWKSYCILNERKSAYCSATAAGSQCNR